MLDFFEFCDQLPMKMTAYQKALIERGHAENISVACRWDGTDPRQCFMVANDDEVRLKRLAEDFGDDEARKRLREKEKRRGSIMRPYWPRWGQRFIIIDNEPVAGSQIVITTTDASSDITIYNRGNGTYKVVSSSSNYLPEYDPDEEDRLRAQSRDPRHYKAQQLDWLHNRRYQKRRSRYPRHI